MMTSFKFRRALAIAAVASAGIPATLWGGPIQGVSTPGVLVPDGSDSGIVSIIDIPASTDLIGDLNVTLTLEAEAGGAWNGDLYVYLAHDGVLSVLVNRPGLSASRPFGYGDPGLDRVTFDDEASLGDFHTYQVALGTGDSRLPITGEFQPDARIADPASVDATDPRTSFLSRFDGRDPSGEWRLFVADLSPGGSVRLAGWQIDIDTAVIPESGTALACASLALVLGLAWRTRYRRG